MKVGESMFMLGLEFIAFCVGVLVLFATAFVIAWAITVYLTPFYSRLTSYCTKKGEEHAQKIFGK